MKIIILCVRLLARESKYHIVNALSERTYIFVVIAFEPHACVYEREDVTFMLRIICIY